MPSPLFATKTWSYRVKNLETSGKFCIEYIIATFKAAIYDTGFCFSYFAVFRTQCNVDMDCLSSKKFEGVYLVKNSQSNQLFSYFQVGFPCFENLFSHSFNLKDLNLNQHFKRLRKNLFFALELNWSDHNLLISPNVPNVCCLHFEIRQQHIKKLALFLRMNKAIHSKP